MVRLNSLEELQDWKRYRDYYRVAFKRLTATDVPLYIGRTDITFSIGGKPWKGTLFLFGDGASTAVRAARREGINFREGTCHVAGKKVVVNDLGAGELRGANETIKKMTLPWRFISANRAKESKASDAGAGSAKKDKKAKKEKQAAAKADYKEARDKVLPKVKALVDQGPPNKKAIVKLVRKLGAHEKAKEFKKGLATVKELIRELKTAAAALRGE